MALKVYINGKILPEAEAVISVYDHGFLYGDGVFDTMRSYQGQVFRFDDHWERLVANSRQLRIPLPRTKIEVAAAIDQLLLANNLTDAYIRLSLSRGNGPIGIDYRLCSEPNLVIMAKELQLKQETYTQGWRIISLKTKRNALESLSPELKSFNFLNNIIAKMELIDRGYPEGIMLNPQGWVAEGTVSNVFFWDGQRLCTPALQVGVLPGVTRKVVIKLAAELGISVQEGFYTLAQLQQAQEVFLTNSSSELIPVVELNQQRIGSGGPGSVTTSLHRKYKELVHI